MLPRRSPGVRFRSSSGRGGGAGCAIDAAAGWRPRSRWSSEVIRIDIIETWEAEARAGADERRLKAIAALMSGSRIRSITRLCEGIRFVDGGVFDSHRDLLNVANGVVDLRTGELRRHDPRLYFTKISPVKYDPDAWSRDWDLALQAVPDDVRGWLHLRLGQAITGHRTSDDVLPILQGSGSNGKTTITGTIFQALGDHAVLIPERSLLVNRGDHPTEMMPFKGARFALIEETPEARHLNVKRLKDAVGTPTMTARRVFHDNETWETTHSLFVTTNYRPRVDEVDHGTWRRLALITFPYRFVAADEVAGPAGQGRGRGLRERLHAGRHGEHEAVLAWLVEGAKSWYANDQMIPPAPPRVREDTLEWRKEADVILNFCTEELVFDPEWHVMSRDLYRRFADWMVERGHQKPSDQTFGSRFQNHSLIAGAQVERRQISRRSRVRTVSPATARASNTGVSPAATWPGSASGSGTPPTTRTTRMGRSQRDRHGRARGARGW